MSFGGKFSRGVFKIEMSCFEPYLISYFPRDKLTSRSGCHEFSGQFMSSQGFFQALLRTVSQVLRAGRKVLPRGG